MRHVSSCPGTILNHMLRHHLLHQIVHRDEIISNTSSLYFNCSFVAWIVLVGQWTLNICIVYLKLWFLFWLSQDISWNIFGLDKLKTPLVELKICCYLPNCVSLWYLLQSATGFVSKEKEGGITFMSFNAKGRGLASTVQEDEDLGEREM